MNKILAVCIAAVLAGGGIAAAAPAHAAGTCTLTVYTPTRTIEGDYYTVNIDPSDGCYDGNYHFVDGSVTGTDGTTFSQWSWDSNSGNTLTAYAPWPDTWTNTGDSDHDNVVFVHDKLITDPNAVVTVKNKQSGTAANLTAKAVDRTDEYTSFPVSNWHLDLQRKHGKKWQHLETAPTNSRGVAHFRNVVSTAAQQYRVVYQGNHYTGTSKTLKVTQAAHTHLRISTKVKQTGKYRRISGVASYTAVTLSNGKVFTDHPGTIRVNLQRYVHHKWQTVDQVSTHKGGTLYDKIYAGKSKWRWAFKGSHIYSKATSHPVQK